MIRTEKGRTPARPARSGTEVPEQHEGSVPIKDERNSIADALVAARPELAELYARTDLQSLADEFALRLVWAGRLSRRMRDE